MTPSEANDATRRARVYQALDNAKGNGFTLESWTDEFLAKDLCDCCADFEGDDPADLIEHVRSWKEAQRSAA